MRICHGQGSSNVGRVDESFLLELFVIANVVLLIVVLSRCIPWRREDDGKNAFRFGFPLHADKCIIDPHIPPVTDKPKDTETDECKVSSPKEGIQQSWPQHLHECCVEKGEGESITTGILGSEEA